MATPTVLDEKRKVRLVKWASWASVALALALLVMKAYAWSVSSSVSVLASALDSFMDVGASLISFFAIRYALQPADTEHRFGHGKAEALAAFMQSCLILLTAFSLVVTAVKRLLGESVIAESSQAEMIMLLSIVLSIVLVLFQRYVVKQTASQAIKADSAHYISDIWSNALVLLALFLDSWGFGGADPLLAIFVAIYIFREAVKILREAFDVLMDHELSSEATDRIKEIISGHEEVYGFHDFRSRCAGAESFVQWHLELKDSSVTLKEAHRIGVELEGAIELEFPRTEVLIHFDYENDDTKEWE